MVVIALMRLCLDGFAFAASALCCFVLSLSHRLKEQDDASDVKDVLPRLREEAKDHLHALNTR